MDLLSLGIQEIGKKFLEGLESGIKSLRSYQNAEVFLLKPFRDT